MKILDAVKTGFTSIAKNIKLWILLAVISLVLMVVSIPILVAIFGQAVPQPGVTPTPEQMANVRWGLFIPFVLVMVLLQTFINAGVVASVKDIIKNAGLNLSKFVTYAKKYFLRILSFGLIMLLAILALSVVFGFLGAIVGAIGNAVGALGAILGFLLAVLGLAVLIFVVIYGSFGPVVIVAEDKSVVKSLKAVLDFMKPRLLKTAGLAAILWIIFIVVAMINNFLTFQGGGVALVAQIITNVINIYLSLVYIASFMAFYLGNAGSAPSSSRATQA